MNEAVDQLRIAYRWEVLERENEEIRQYREKRKAANNQVFMRFVPKMNGVECEETLWKYSPKSWGMHA